MAMLVSIFNFYSKKRHSAPPNFYGTPSDRKAILYPLIERSVRKIELPAISEQVHLGICQVRDQLV
jgi:hypothetical protein